MMGASTNGELCVILPFSIAGNSSLPSSNARPFYFDKHHELVRTTSSFSWTDFDQICKKIEISQYNLGELFQHLKVSRGCLNAWAENVTSPAGAAESEIDLMAWIWSLASQLKLNLPELQFTADTEVKAFLEGLVPFLASTRNRCDGAVLKQFDEWMVPILLLEVHSSPYKNSVSKTAVDVIDQLRLLRSFNPHIHECSGFTFPKYREPSFVTEVRVTFSGFRFKVSLQPLKREEVKERIDDVLKNNFSFHVSDPLLCFIRLSEDELKQMSDKFQAGSVKQKKSKHSIVVYDEDRFFKYAPTSFYRETLGILKSEIKSPKHISLHSDEVYIGRLRFFSFPKLLPPLNHTRVRKCLEDFVVKTATALIELHGFGYAHLDVRLPNISFKVDDHGEYYVKLIDLDRCREIESGDSLSYEGEMYRFPSTWDTSQLD